MSWDIHMVGDLLKRGSYTSFLVVLTYLFFFNSKLMAQEERFDCVITPSAVIGISSSDPGVLEDVLVERSTYVKKGQLLATLESSVEEVDRDLAKAQSKMTSIVKLREVDVSFSQKDLKRVRSLYEKKMISSDVKEKAEKELELASWRLRDAKDILKQRQIKLKKAEAILLRRKVFSPVDGIVIERINHPGEYVDEEPILKVAKLDPLFVEVVVPLVFAKKIKTGMSAKISPEVLDTLPLEGHVIVVDEVGDAASGTFGVRVSLPNPDLNLPAGIKCNVAFKFTELGRERFDNLSRPQ